jgi:rhodanese-related sulfurtransferase
MTGTTTTRFLVWWAVLALAWSATAGEPLTWARLNTRIAERFPHSRSISVETLQQKLKAKEKVVLIDVRPEPEYRVSRLTGAVRIETAREIQKQYGSYKGVLVLYCSVGYRSGEIADRLSRDGMGNVYNLKGSIFKWADQGQPVVNQDGPTKYVHPYDEYWGRLLSKARHRYR